MACPVLLLEPLRAGVQIPVHALDGGRFVACGDGVHEFAVAFVREAVEAAAAVLPKQVGVENDAEADVQLM